MTFPAAGIDVEADDLIGRRCRRAVIARAVIVVRAVGATGVNHPVGTMNVQSKRRGSVARSTGHRRQRSPVQPSRILGPEPPQPALVTGQELAWPGCRVVHAGTATHDQGVADQPTGMTEHRRTRPRLGLNPGIIDRRPQLNQIDIAAVAPAADQHQGALAPHRSHGVIDRHRHRRYLHPVG